VPVYGYQSIDIHCIAVPVKFDGGLSMSFLRNEQLFTKNWGSKPISFQKVPIFKNISNPAIWKKDRPSPWNCPIFLVNGINNPPSNLT
jgi:hypothetical protein